MTQIRVYLSGVFWGSGKKVADFFARQMFTPEEDAYTERLVGKLYDCRPIDSVLTPDGVKEVQTMMETDNYRGLLRLLKKEILLSDKPWCVEAVLTAVQALNRCVPDILYKTTTAYLYGNL